MSFIVKRISTVALLAAVLFLTGRCVFCQSPGPERFLKVVFPGGKAVTAELAVTDEERARGLMFRRQILPDQGMLFVFGEPGLHSFWMKNTLVSLDILWLGPDRRVIYIERNVPPCTKDPCPSYGPDEPALYVLELIAGGADANGLKPGDRIEFVLPPWVAPLLEER